MRLAPVAATALPRLDNEHSPRANPSSVKIYILMQSGVDLMIKSHTEVEVLSKMMNAGSWEAQVSQGECLRTGIGDFLLRRP